MRIKKIMAAMIIAAISVGFASCSDNYSVLYSKISLNNDTELKTILTAKGYTFNESGNLELNDFANNTKSLDLSGTKISEDNLKDLSIFPNLTDIDLSENEYTDSFDFAKLPSQITGVDLTGNELYEFPGLVDIKTEENGDETVTVTHPLTKLYLPESAKYNCNEIVDFYTKATGADIKMADANGTLTTYNTLRGVPNEAFRTILKKTFPSLFDGDSIDISRVLVNSTEKSKAITTGLSKIENIEGFQYVLYNKGYEGTTVELTSTKSTTIPYLTIKKNIYKLILNNIDTPNDIDLSQAKNLCVIIITENPSIETIDLSASTLLGQRGDAAEFAVMDTPSMVTINSCVKLKTLIFPKAATACCCLEAINLPLLQSIDLSRFQAMYMLSLAGIPTCKILYLTPERLIFNSKIYFAIDKDTYNKAETKTFLDVNHTDKLIQSTLSAQGGCTTYLWSKNYK